MKIHFSIDDIIGCFRYITNNNVESIFDTRFFCNLKEWHDKYGLKVTLYIFENDGKNFHINMLPDKYRNEISNNATWIQLMYHGPNTLEHLNETEFNQCFKKEYLSFCNVFNKYLFTDIVRLHCWNGNSEVLRLLTSDDSISTFLCPEVGKQVSSFYDLTEEECTLVYDKMVQKNGRLYIRTDIRYDNLENINVLKDLLRKSKTIVIYGHEWCFNSKLNIIEEMIKEISQNGGEFIVEELSTNS